MPRMRWRPGQSPGPAGGAHDAPPDPIVGRGGAHPSPRTPRAPRSSRFQRSALAARRLVSKVYPPKFLAMHHKLVL